MRNRLHVFAKYDKNDYPQKIPPPLLPKIIYNREMKHYTRLPHTYQQYTKKKQSLIHIKKNTDTALSIENIFKQTLKRITKKIIPYIIIQIYMISAIAIILLLCLLHGGAHIFLYFITQSLVLTIFSGIFFLLLIIIAGMYLLTWLHLTSLSLLISDEKRTIMQILTETQPYTWQFMLFQGLLGAFLFGLLPLHILSLSGTFIIWSIWALFSYIIFIKDHPPRLDSMWRSYHTVQQRFWDIVGRLTILFLSYIVIFLIINILPVSQSLVSGIQGIFLFLTTPFTIAYVYEIYIHLPKQKYARPVQGWVHASTGGWILMVCICLISIITLIQNPQYIFDILFIDEVQTMLEQMETIF